jgi:predicted ribosomally synthesized peptide with SipW-like signal peptide
MEKPDLTRRQMLSGIAVTGGAGALTGRGTAALLSDEETFTNNSVTASASTAGVIALDVTIDSLDNADGLIYTIEVPDLANNNPSYIWIQPVTCPDPIDAAEDVDVELRVECPDSGDTVIITDGTLRTVVDELRTGAGEPLRCSSDETARCFEPGENVELVLEVIDSSTEEDFTFELEFYAEQCRYNTGATTPFDSLSTCDTGDPPDLGKGISFIAFCSEPGEMIDPTILSRSEFDDDGAPRSLEWETDNGVNYVVVKAGQNFTIYEYSSGNTTTDTVTTGGNDDADFYGSEPKNNRSSDPCELAAEKFGSGSFPSGGTSVKLEWDGNKFVSNN